MRALVKKMMTDQSEGSQVKRPMTAAFKGVERDKAYGSYMVSITGINKMIEKEA